MLVSSDLVRYTNHYVPSFLPHRSGSTDSHSRVRHGPGAPGGDHTGAECPRDRSGVRGGKLYQPVPGGSIWFPDGQNKKQNFS